MLPPRGCEYFSFPRGAALRHGWFLSISRGLPNQGDKYIFERRNNGPDGNRPKAFLMEFLFQDFCRRMRRGHKNMEGGAGWFHADYPFEYLECLSDGSLVHSLDLEACFFQ